MFNVFTNHKALELEYDLDIINNLKESVAFCDEVLKKDYKDKLDNLKGFLDFELTIFYAFINLRNKKFNNKKLENKFSPIKKKYTLKNIENKELTVKDYIKKIYLYRIEMDSFISESSYYLKQKSIWFKK